jgi:peptidoglycan/xylan/chitin deacetylase (PgdA/CDA1 family)
MKFVFKDMVFSLTRPIEKLVGLKKLINLSGQDRIFPFYHLVADENPIHIKHLYEIKSISDFNKDLDFLLKNYEPLDLNDIQNFKSPGSSSRKPGFFLSFDDGLRAFYEVIAPILLQRGIPAACFLNTAFVDNKDIFYRYKASLLIEAFEKDKSLEKSEAVQSIIKTFSKNLHTTKSKLLSVDYTNKHILDDLAKVVQVDFDQYLKDQKPYLETTEIQTLVNQGFYFGGHSIDHPLYHLLSKAEQIDQTEKSVSWIIENFNLPYRLFSFPFSDDQVEKTFFEYFEETNLVSFGTAGLKKGENRNHFQRIPMERNGLEASSIIKSEYIYYILKSFLRKN